MDCCNYMQYRHPYYSSQFYENGLYNRDYYGHPYQSYYANSHYYPQQWPCAASFQDYVYNPKEARIRKAMREASRERVVGTAPIPSPRGGRRSQTWTSNPEEQLMMAPSPELGGPLCSSPIFSGPPSGVGQFIPPINSYSKLVHVLPSPGWLPPESPTYLQHNPMAELQQHQANMWHQYQEPMRTCSGPPYMLESQMNLYQDVNPNDVLPQKKCKSEADAFSNSNRPVENPQPPKSDRVEKVVKNEKMEENKDTVDDAQTLVDSGNFEQTETFLPVFQETILVQNPFDKDDDLKMKKDLNSIGPQTVVPLSNDRNLKPPSDILPEYPVLKGLPPESCPPLNDLLDYHNHCLGVEKINTNCCGCMTLPCSTLLYHNPCNLDTFLMDNTNPNLIYTDVGVIPLYDNNLDVETLLHNMSSILPNKELNINDNFVNGKKK